jgi:hypothetical protein
VPPSDHAPQERKTAHISGIGEFLPQLQEYKETDKYEPTESWLQRKTRVKLEKKQRQENLLKEAPVLCEGDSICSIFYITCPTSGHFVSRIAQGVLTLLLPRQTSRRPKYSR